VPDRQERLERKEAQMEKRTCGACLETTVSIKSRHSRESGNPVFPMGSGFPGQAGE